MRSRRLLALLVLAALSTPTAVVAQIRLVDVSVAAGVVHESGPAPDYGPAEAGQSAAQNGAGVAVGDVDGDGDVDVYLLGNRGTANQLLRNVSEPGAPRFEDATTPVLADTGQARVAHIVDLDGDGAADILLVNDVGPDADAGSRLLRGDGAGGFVDVTAGSGFEPLGWPHGGAAIADVDQDGHLDVYLTSWAGGFGSGTPFEGHNELFLGQGDFRFTRSDRAPSSDARDNFTPVFAQLDDEPGLDLFVAVDHAEDLLFVGRGARLRDVSERAGVTHVSTDMGVACADFDDDGDLDIFTTNIFFTNPFFESENAFYDNALAGSGQLEFTDRARDLGVEDTRWGWGTEPVDLDGDGDLDLVAVNGFEAFIDTFGGEERLATGPGYLFERVGDGFTRVLGTDLDMEGDERALVALDADGDGDQDLLITRMDGSARLLDNQTAGHGAVVTVSLEPPAHAFGATVRGSVDGVRKRRDALPSRSYLVGAPATVTFGLGGAAGLESVEVQWADGARSVLPTLAAGGELVARRCEAAGECAPGPDGASRCMCVAVVEASGGGCSVAPTRASAMLLTLLALLVFWTRKRAGA